MLIGILLGPGSRRDEAVVFIIRASSFKEERLCAMFESDNSSHLNTWAFPF
jgi:hypothetical protein